MGGLARRASAIKDHRRKNPKVPVLVVETGNSLKQGASLDDPMNRWVIEALSAAGTHAANATPAELLRLNRLAELGKAPDSLLTRYVSSVVKPGSGGAFRVQPYAKFELSADEGDAKVRVGVLAVSRASAGGGTGGLLDVDAALSRFLPEVEQDSDLVVVLARTDDRELGRIASSFPAIDVIINGNALGEGREFERTGNAVMVESAHGGVALGLLDLEWDEAGRVRRSSNQVVPLPPMIPDDPQIARIADKAHIEWLAFLEEEARKSPPLTMPTVFAGAAVCRDCHEKAYKVWEKSAHAHAIDSLEKTGDHYNTECLLCHVTGYGETRGFVNVLRTPELTGVQCEACHTAARQHSERPQQFHPGSEFGITFKRAVRKEFCLNCHTEENSPRFNHETYWAKIAH